jgi:hypothetical protein
VTYEQPHPYTQSEAAEAFRSRDPAVVCSALIGVVYHDADWRWVQSQCVLLSSHPEPMVRGLVATCFGHLARIHRQIDRSVADRVLRCLAADPDPNVSGRVSDALDDFKIYLEPTDRIGLA